MKKSICIVLLLLFYSIVDVCSQSFLSLIVNDIRTDNLYCEEDYMCYEMYKPSFANLEYDDFIGLAHKLETWLDIESICVLDSISKNLHPISMKKELTDCEISKKRLVSIVEIEQIRKKAQMSKICKQRERTFKWYQFPRLHGKLSRSKCDKTFYFFSAPLQVGDFQIIELVRIMITVPFYKDRYDSWYYIYNRKTNEFKKSFKYANY